MSTFKGQTVGKIVADDYRTAQVFRNFGLDFCCGGKRTLEEACDKKGIKFEKLEKELNALNNNGADRQNYKSWSPNFLIDYIINNHHQFVRTKLPEIEFYAKKVAKVHGSRHEELNEIRQKFLKLQDDLLSHLEKEEQLLFPYIKSLVELDNSQKKADQRPHFGTVKKTINMMETEHDEAGDIMKQISKLSNSFTPPEDACTTYRLFYQNLEGFEKDLHKHVHLENNILFPKALELENRIN